MNHFTYKGYTGSVEASLPDNCVHGRILFITDLVNYEAETLAELKKEFEAAVDDYLETCKELDIEPKKPFKGSFNVRIGQKLHEEAATKAASLGKSLNDYIKDIIRRDTETHA